MYSLFPITLILSVVLGFLVDKDELINYQLLIIYGLLLRIFTYQPTVDKTILYQPTVDTGGSVDDS